MPRMRKQKCLQCGYTHTVVDQFPLLPIVACGKCPDMFIDPDAPDFPSPRQGIGEYRVEDRRDRPGAA